MTAGELGRPAARLLIGGVASGAGKTTFTLGLCRALMRRGHAVSVFKCGPDYLDPTYHRAASGRSVHNLDGWLMGPRALRASFMRQAGEISLIEGVMGLFDGASPTDLSGSSAEVALLLESPVLLVCDASGMARSVAALAHGFATFEPRVKLGGLICNRVGSAGHLDLLRRASSAVPVLGGLTKDPAASFPERHLGLQSAGEIDVAARIEAWADQVERHCDVAALLELALTAPPLAPPPEPAPPLPRRARIALAEDAAFHFYYEENLHLLERAGAELVRFSPLADAQAPDVDGVYVGGGYPELHAARLASNTRLIEGLRRLAQRGVPIYGECGGLMYLCDAIVTLNGERHSMLGLVPGVASMTSKLQALGYVEVDTRSDTVLGPAGTRFRGHQFRYSRFESPSPPSAYDMRVTRTGETLAEGYAEGNVLGSYVHAHWAQHPEVPMEFVERCAAYARGKQR